MRIIRSLAAMSEVSRKLKEEGARIGFVPTMGAFHQGHLSLVRQARRDADKVIVSIFVNPIQFGPKEDFKKYPRGLKGDCKLAKAAGADFIFSPDKDRMFPRRFLTHVEVYGLSDVLCGRFRPGHFRGVATVVAKLFNIVRPDIAYFGRKDAQQATIIKRMVNDLNMPVRLKVMPIVREKDGLAMSSRNAYLNKQEREDSVVLFQALNQGKALIKQGKRNCKDIINKIKAIINKKNTARIDYIEIIDPDCLTPLKAVRGKALIALAVYVGKTRLIDNVLINSQPGN